MTVDPCFVLGTGIIRKVETTGLDRHESAEHGEHAGRRGASPLLNAVSMSRHQEAAAVFRRVHADLRSRHI